ncbi:hypothetical protein CW304_26840 [Bacillus sp. UFRGS-B20]|nr:hypothetical protein CW304_26840 [Bacillus sp. UFRGS-B20]
MKFINLIAFLCIQVLPKGIPTGYLSVTLNLYTLREESVYNKRVLLILGYKINYFVCFLTVQMLFSHNLTMLRCRHLHSN